MATQKTDKPRLTYADLCRMFPEEDNVRREIIDGELLVTPSATARHQRVVARCLIALDAFAREQGGEALVSPLDTQFSDFDVVQPDVLYVEENVFRRPAIPGEPLFEGDGCNVVLARVTQEKP